jgi:hypothetical protein
MWELMNGMANNMRNRFRPPRRQNGVGTMTAMLLGASVGIAAWETMRRSRNNGSMPTDAAKVAQEVMDSLDK